MGFLPHLIGLQLSSVLLLPRSPKAQPFHQAPVWSFEDLGLILRTRLILRHKAWCFQALTAGNYEASLSYYSGQIIKDLEIEAICTPAKHSSLV